MWCSTQEIDEVLPEHVVSECERTGLVDPHQGRIEHEPPIHAEIERELHGFDGVVAAIRIAGKIGLTHAADEVPGAAPIGERPREGQENEIAAGNECGGQAGIGDGNRDIAGERGVGQRLQRIEPDQVVVAEPRAPGGARSSSASRTRTRAVSSILCRWP